MLLHRYGFICYNHVMGLYVTTMLWVYMLLQCYGFICYYTVMGLYVATLLWVYMLLHCYGFICYYNVMKQTIHGALKGNELNSVHVFVVDCII